MTQWSTAVIADLLGIPESDRESVLHKRHPGGDLLSRLAGSRADDALTRDEMISTAILLFGAGFETTTNLPGNGLNALLRHPDQLAGLRADPSLIPDGRRGTPAL
ncbi:hypothetical protein ACGFNU_47035 [Spirillospora sp. NPDC048911]|uniref:hypothetical protein n=1 Tax=Spirillospora sp. NPDC048911 TaxID=3364527 RepID=UPI00371701C4